MVGTYKDMPTHKPASAPKLAVKPAEVKVAHKVGETTEPPIKSTGNAVGILNRILRDKSSLGK